MTAGDFESIGLGGFLEAVKASQSRITNVNALNMPLYSTSLQRTLKGVLLNRNKTTRYSHIQP